MNHSNNQTFDNNAYLPQLQERVNALSNILEQKSLNNFKDINGLRSRMIQTKEILNALASSQHLDNKALYSNLTEISEIVKNIKHQIDKYQNTNNFKRPFVAQEIRHKLVNQKDNLSF